MLLAPDMAFRLFILSLHLLLVSAAPAYSQDCTARIKQGKSPYPHIKSGQKLIFWSYSIGTLGEYPQYGVVKSLVGDRLLMIPVKDLYDVSPGCSRLKEYKENY
jgi:hypothetical protein